MKGIVYGKINATFLPYNHNVVMGSHECNDLMKFQDGEIQ